MGIGKRTHNRLVQPVIQYEMLPSGMERGTLEVRRGFHCFLLSFLLYLTLVDGRVRDGQITSVIRVTYKDTCTKTVPLLNPARVPVGNIDES